MAFHDTRLPVSVNRGVKGGPRFKTTVMSLASGFEKRNIEWSLTRGFWDAGYAVQTTEELKVLVDFFYARQGKAHSFRLRDWSDFQVGEAETTTPQEIGVGTGAQLTFQLEKRYTSGGYTFHRVIAKPTNGTTRVWLGAVEQMSGWSMNYLTGLLTFSSAPLVSVSVKVLTEFDVPVRFDTDDLNITMEMFNNSELPTIPLIEVRGE